VPAGVERSSGFLPRYPTMMILLNEAIEVVLLRKLWFGPDRAVACDVARLGVNHPETAWLVPSRPLSISPGGPQSCWKDVVCSCEQFGTVALS
jgi:hypothetical protein